MLRKMALLAPLSLLAAAPVAFQPGTSLFGEQCKCPSFVWLWLTRLTGHSQGTFCLVKPIRRSVPQDHLFCPGSHFGQPKWEHLQNYFVPVCSSASVFYGWFHQILVFSGAEILKESYFLDHSWSYLVSVCFIGCWVLYWNISIWENWFHMNKPQKYSVIIFLMSMID